MIRCGAILLCVLLLVLPVVSQQSATSDPQAQAAISQSVKAMGGSTPADSAASGSVQIASGSGSYSGTFQITTRGILQSREVLKTSDGTQDHVYSLGQASTVSGTTVTPVSLQQGCSFQAAFFPLPLLQAALANPDSVFQYVGQEALGGIPTVHVRLSNSYASQAQKLHSLAAFSIKDVWLDAGTLLPRRIAFDSRSADGAAPTVRISLDFAGFQNAQGVLYPTTVTESLNSTKWGTFSVQTVAFNTGLSDSDFPVQ